MFKKQSKSPFASAIDAAADAFAPKKAKPSHKKRNATIAIVVGSALVTGLVGKGKKADA